jgi:hypothetical protein
MTGQLAVGGASAVITPPPGRRMAGYIRRSGPAEAVLDDLRCRAVVLEDGRTRLAIVACDLLYATEALTARIRERVADLVGIPGEHVMVTATHTHCGPGSLAGECDPPLLSAIAARAGEAVAEAAVRSCPARLAVGAVRVPGVAWNRRDPAAPADDRVDVVVALPERAEGEAIATIMSFACHPTVLEYDTRAWSPDFPGALCAVVERVCGGVGIFLQGCAADVNPVFLEHTATDCRRVGGILGAASARLALELATLAGDPRTINLSWEEEVPAAIEPVGRLVEAAPLRGFVRHAEAVVRTHPDPDTVRRELAALRRELEATEDVATRRRLAPRAAELWAEDLFVSGADALEDVDHSTEGPDLLPVQAFRLGAGLVLLALPGEPFASTGAALRDHAAGTVLVAGYANRSVGYLPPIEEYESRGYEVGRAQYAAGTAEALTAVARELIDELMEEGA